MRAAGASVLEGGGVFFLCEWEGVTFAPHTRGGGWCLAGWAGRRRERPQADARQRAARRWEGYSEDKGLLMRRLQSPIPPEQSSLA